MAYRLCDGLVPASSAFLNLRAPCGKTVLSPQAPEGGGFGVPGCAQSGSAAAVGPVRHFAKSTAATQGPTRPTRARKSRRHPHAAKASAGTKASAPKVVGKKSQSPDDQDTEEANAAQSHRGGRRLAIQQRRRPQRQQPRKPGAAAARARRSQEKVDDSTTSDAEAQQAAATDGQPPAGSAGSAAERAEATAKYR